MKKLIYIFGVVILLFSCNNNNVYQIEGQLSYLESTTLYAVYESLEGNAIDTVTCDEKGQFSIFRERDNDLFAITIYYNDRKNWFAVFPEVDKPIQVKGDARYPQLIQVKGGRTNNKLSEFKKKAESLLKERTDLSANTKEQSLSNGESASQLANINHELRRIIHDFITKNPKEEASAILISEFFTDPNEIIQAEESLNMLDTELDDYYIVKDLKTQIEKAKTTIVGAKAPTFRVTNIYGQTFTANSFANKYYILAFTALWCDMCQTEVMFLDNIATKYPKDSLDILLISLDDEFNEVRKAVHKDTINWNLVTDSAGQAIKLFETYNVSTLPKCFLMDKDGRIILNTSNGMELQQTVDELLNR